MALQNEHILFLSNIYNFIPIFFTPLPPIYRELACTRQCECVGAKTSSFTEEQVSRNLRISYSDISIL